MTPYYNGHWYHRMEIKSKPSGKQCTFQLCMWSDGWSKETCSGCVTFHDEGVYWDDMGSPSGWWKHNGGPNWSTNFQAVGIMVKQNNCGDMLLTDGACGSHCYPGSDLADHVPIVWQHEVVCVAPGSELEVPAEWTDCPWGETSIGVGRLHGAGHVDNMKLHIIEIGDAVRVTVPAMTGTVVFYDAKGAALRTLRANADQPTGVVWDKKAQGGGSIAPGVYVVRARTPSGTASGRITLSH
ncbi:MAG: hypothetical protein GF418_11150 [Chitinivibrionales bacterium]|nr:hypothetical protein [Chitinivibrionales bacterium]MBD3396172.1 hypothetical protein [Chitinivibrionales bacterium]